MPSFDYPNISGKKSNEENMQCARSWMMQMTDNMNYYVTKLESRIDVLEKKLSEMEEK